MLLLLIRHAETEHNVAGLLAGITDSRLTSHGALQTQRLADSLVDQRGVAFSHIFSSDLSRARITADAIHNAQTQIQTKASDAGDLLVANIVPERTALEALREQDFGSLECQAWAPKSPGLKGPNGNPSEPGHPGFRPKESLEAMAERIDGFLEASIAPLLASDSSSQSTVAVVSHGIILGVLWKALLSRFGPQSVSLGPDAITGSAANKPLEYLPVWSNTGYLELEIRNTPSQPDTDVTLVLPGNNRLAATRPLLDGYQMLVKTVNSREHLNGLKRTRGGLGSSTFDEKQKNLDHFFGKARV